jgi:acyl transferase domain-containing protein
MPFHLHLLISLDHMRVIGAVYHDLIVNHLNPRLPVLPFFSSVHGRLLSKAHEFTAKYWQDNLKNPVLFSTAVNVAIQNCPNAHIHLEVGPHSALAGPLKQIYAVKDTSKAYFSALKRNTNDVDTFLETMGQLYLAGVKLRLPIADSAHILTDLPTYPWHHSDTYWEETRVTKNWRFPRHAKHDLLGARILESSDVEPSWRNILRLVDVPWLRDHRVGSDIVFPAAGYAAMAGAAATQLRESDDTHLDYTIQEVCISNALLLRDDSSSELITTLRPKALTTELDSKWYEFCVLSHEGSSWSRHCRGLVTTGRARKFTGTDNKKFTRGVSTDRWYKTMARIGLNYGPKFTSLQNITARVSDRVCSGTVINSTEKWESTYAMHPTTLDVIFQSVIVARAKGLYRQLTQLLLPTFVEELYVAETNSATIHFNTTATETQGSSYGFVDDKIVLFAHGLKMTPLQGGIDDDLVEPSAQHLQWKPDVYFVNLNELIEGKVDLQPQLALAERLFVLCAAEAQSSLSGLNLSQPHFASFIAWLERQLKRFDGIDYPLVEDSQLLLRLDSAARRHEIADCLVKIQ